MNETQLQATFLCLAFAAAATILWYFAGTYLSPATDISPAAYGKWQENKLRSTDRVETNMGTDVTMGADYCYNGPPFLNTVNVRSILLQSLLTAIVFLFGSHGILAVLRQSVWEAPVWWTIAALVFLVLASWCGFQRHVWRMMLARASVFPVVDSRGRPAFVYLGTVPSNPWNSSPWFRAATWSVVTAASLTGAAITANLVAPSPGSQQTSLLLAVLGLRWTLSWAAADVLTAACVRSSR